MNGPTQELVDFALGVKFEDLPTSVVDMTREVIFDAVGCSLGGYALEKIKIALEFVSECGGNSAAGIIGGGRTSLPMAAFANGELINALDFDSMGPLAGHVIPYVFPSCLAAAERTHASGKDLIAATALALEMGGRVMASVLQQRIPKDEPPYYEVSPRYSHSPSIFGAVAGASKLLGLNREKMANALGIGGVNTPVAGNTKYHKIMNLPMVKYNSWSGWIAQLATVSALLAEKGFTGDTTVLDGEWGFWKMYGSPFFNTNVALGGLGKVWHFDDIRFKKYPCCSLDQAGIASIYKAVRENAIDPDTIEHIVVHVEPWLFTKSRSGTEVKDAMRAQMCNAYIFAAAAYYGGKPGPEWQSARTINNPKMKELMKKIDIKAHPKAEEAILKGLKEGRMPVIWEATAEVTAGGKTARAEVVADRNSCCDKMTHQDLEGKFRNNASYSMVRSDKIEKAIKMLNGLEKVKDVAELVNTLTI